MTGGILAAIPLASAGASSLSTTTLATKGQTGAGANEDIHKARARTVSADGRVTVFSSPSSNLTSGPHNAMEQVYAYDRITQKTILVSRNAAGEPASGGSYVPTISADGRFVAYATTARDVAPGLDKFCLGSADPCTNIIVHDLITKYTQAVNVDSDGKRRLPAIQTGVGGQAPVITRDGRYVTFLTYHRTVNNTDGYRLVIRNLEGRTTRVIELTNADDQISESGFWDATINDTGRFIAFSTDERLTRFDYNGQPDIYLYDLWDNNLIFVTSGLYGFGASNSTQPVISTDGNFIVYESTAPNLVPGDNNHKVDVFLYNRAKGTTTLVSKSTKGALGTDNSFAADISGDGQYVVYASYAPNLVRADTTNIDVFLYYTNFGATRLISRASHNGVPSDNHSLDPSISQNGKAITFLSKAHNLTSDTIDRNTLFSNLFIGFDDARPIPYYDQTDLLELL
ncbi:MAG TPA: hypothetical protein VMT30_05040 [Candidatus Saccharimonadia bacterium]|nr:hypothetical protein [Candidatus Saccharimonadia bacterium]